MAPNNSGVGRLKLLNVCDAMPYEQLMPDFDFVRRKVVQSRIHAQLRAMYGLSSEAQLQSLLAFIKHLKQMPMATDADAVREEAYEMPAEAMELILGKRLKLSCVYYPTSSSSLDEAEDAMLDLCCERAGIRDGQNILDIGGGYGSLALYAAQKFPSSHITSLSFSKSMKEYIDQQCRLQGINNVTAVNADIVKYETVDIFDRVIAIQTIEHFKNFEQLFKKIATLMKPDALFFVEIGCHKQFAYHTANGQKEALVMCDSQQAGPQESFFGEFSDCAETLLAENTLLYFQDDLTVVDHWRVNGVHQARSCVAWSKNVDKNFGKLCSILTEAYKDEKKAAEQLKSFRNYWFAWAEMMSFNGGGEWFCAHQLFKKKSNV